LDIEDSPVQIRVARPPDSAEVARLSCELGYPASAEEMAPRLDRLLALGDDHCVIVAAADSTRLLGWIHVGRRDLLEVEPRAEILGLVVDATARTRGIGRALVTAAEKWASEHGFAEMVVRSAITRQESHPFYERIGYRRTKSQHVYLKQIGGSRSSQ
jgi:GNAT superfamily N-acetyltransferase